MSVQILDKAVNWLLTTPPTPSTSSSPSAREAFLDLTNTSPLTSPDLESAIKTEKSKLEKPKSLLETLAAEKKANPLPQINPSQLLPPQDVLNKYPKLLCNSRIPRLAVKLCKESYFGEDIMKKCTVKGTGKHHALPEKKLKELRLYLIDLCVPRITPSTVEFEALWKICLESIGQCCKTLRSCGAT